jgi:predicted ribosome quality control (RQC) complex YloA/Tae2 family protein
MEGIYLSSLVPLVEDKLHGQSCRAVGMTSSSTLSLKFGTGWFHLHAKPGSANLWWTDTASTVPPDSPSWEHHLKGAPVEKVTQQGTDRVLEIHFAGRSPYDAGGIRLVFEATGRNANIILVRTKDSRILASLRKVLSGVNRFRTISPGVVYKAPPSSGFPLEEWGSDKVQQLLQTGVTPKLLYQNLEGVGPASAKAIIAAPDSPAESVRELAHKLLNKQFTPWLTKFGRIPVSIGEGSAIQNPLAPPAEKAEGGKAGEYRPSRVQLGTILKKRISSENKRIKSSQKSLGRLASPDELRSWGNLVLTFKNDLRKGMKKAVLTNWEGTQISIKLKQSLNPAENANRYFRKAGRVHLEKNRLEQRIQAGIKRMNYLSDILQELDTITDLEVTQYLKKLGETEKKVTGAPLEYILEGGWRCLVGRNAKQNDHLTFKLAVKTDIWLHARGVTGAHVILKRDGRTDNPPASILDLAAHIAAKHSSTNGVVPVDWTLVKYVRRMKGGGPGQVVYVREKTLFAEA